MSMAADMQKAASRLQERADRVAAQLSTWTIVANAASLGFTLSFARDSEVAKALPLEWAYGLFLAGMVFGFIGQLAEVRALRRLHAHASDAQNIMFLIEARNEFATQLIEKGAEVPPDWEVENQKSHEKLGELQKVRFSLAEWAGPACAALAVTVLLVGLALPLFFNVL